MARPSASRPEPARRRRALVFARYCALQLPDLAVVGGVLFALNRWWELGERAAMVLFGIWVLKDLAMFPLLRVAYEGGSRGGAEALVGALGTAREALDPDGWVRIGAELWRARLARPGPDTPPESVQAGAAVRVVGVRGLMLEVTPAGDA